jgi:hypothetical protein
MAKERAPRAPYRKPELLNSHRKIIFFTAVNHLHSNNGAIVHGFFSDLSSGLPCGAKAVARHWKNLKAEYEVRFGPIRDINLTTMMTSIPDEFFDTKKKGSAQNACKYVKEDLAVALAAIPLSKRQTLRHTAAALGIPATTFHHFVKAGEVVRHTSALKPVLTEENMVARVEYALNKINPATLLGTRGAVKYWDDYDEIDVDEKWFHLTYDGVRYYMTPAEKRPDRRVRHKGYIDKVMFLSAVARPKKLPDGTYFDGKIGIWPFGRYEAAKRASKLRAAGTLCWKNTQVNANVYRDMMIDEVVPAIMARWPQYEYNNPNFKIRIQQDGAPSHINIGGNDPWYEFLEEIELADKFILYNQPANSPDLNINDLGFFRAIESVYKKEVPRTYDDIINMVVRVYWDYPREKLNRMWLTRQSCCNKIFEHCGNNNYAIPHMNKERMERLGPLPDAIPVAEVAKTYLGMSGMVPDEDDDELEGVTLEAV